MLWVVLAVFYVLIGLGCALGGRASDSPVLRHAWGACLVITLLWPIALGYALSYACDRLEDLVDRGAGTRL